MKEKFFDLLVSSFYDSYQIGDLGEIITEATAPYDDFICELLKIDEEEYNKMIDNACEIARGLHHSDMIKQLKNVGLIQKD